MAKIPPPPPGFTLDAAVPPPPPGFTLDTQTPNRAMLDMSPTAQTPQPQQEQKPGILDRLAFSTPVQAVVDLPVAAAQIALSGPDTLNGMPLSGIAAIPGARKYLREKVQNFVNGREKAYLANPENRNWLGDLNRGIINAVAGGRFLPALNAPGRSFLAQGAAGAMSAPVLGETEDVAKGKLIQGGVGAATAGVLKAIPAVGQGVRRIAFGKAEERATALARAEATRAATGAEPSLGESLRNPNIQAVENLTEYIPLAGRGKQLARTNQTLQEKVGKITGDLAPDLGTAGAGHEISASADRKLAENMAKYGKPFNEVRAALDAQPGSVSPTRTISAFDDAIAAESKITNNEATVNALKSQRDQFASGEYGDTFDKLMAEKAQFQSDAAAGEAGDAASKRLSRHQSQIAGAIKDDIDDATFLADPTGKLSQKYKDANIEYAKHVHEFNPDQPTSWEGYRKESRVLRGRGEFQGDIAPNVLRGDNPDMAKYTKRALDERGHSAVKAEIWSRIDKAANTVEAGGTSKGKVFSPAKAAAEIDAHMNFIKEFYPPEEVWKIKGLRNGLKELERAGQYMEQLQTGKYTTKIGQLGALGSAGQLMILGHPAALMGEISTMGAARLYNKLSGSRAGKEWLLQVGSKAPGSAAIGKLMTKLPAVLGMQHKGTPQEQE